MIAVGAAAAADDDAVNQLPLTNYSNEELFDIAVLLHEMNYVSALEFLRSSALMCMIDLMIYYAHDYIHSIHLRLDSMMNDRLG